MNYLYVLLFVAAHFAVVQCEEEESNDTSIQAYFVRDSFKEILAPTIGLEVIEEKYLNFLSDKGRVQLLPLNGMQIVEDLSYKIGILMQNRTDIVGNASQFAEQIASNYTYQPDLKNVAFLNMRNTTPFTDTSWTHLDKFQQVVNTNQSGVQIPIEIYEGSPEIQNDLSWSSQLENHWKQSYAANPNLLYQYLCTHSGLYRVYPGLQWKNETPVDTYDCRSRTWFIQGASSPKDMVILIDTSASTHGQSLSLMKYTAKALLDTLAENDYINVIHFAKEANTVGCFKTQVLASYRNKQKLKNEIDHLQANGQADYSVGFKAAFDMLEHFNYTGLNGSDDGQGAQCNRMIMFLTDGGTDVPTEVFEKYNADKRVRIFSFVVGPGANPFAAVREISCSNRGFFSRIPAMGAIGTAVNRYLQPLGSGLVAADIHDPQWSVGVLTRGLGMVTSITLPVYNRSLAGNNQMLLGVVGTDLKISELDDMMPIRQLGPNGYGFVILATGYLLSHPDLIAKYGWLTNPPPFDLLEIEYDSPEKEVVRTLIVNATKPGHIAVTAFVNVPDKRHADNKTRIYYYAPVHLSSRFRVAIVLPDYSKFYLASVPHMDVSEGLSYLQTPASAVLLARWPYCKNMLQASNTSTWQEDLLFTVANNYSSCDVDALQKLFSDAKITAEMNAQWLKSSYITRSLSDVRAVFVATNNGLTRVFPSNFSSDFEGMTYVWNETYYRRALDNSELWMFSAAYQAPGGNASAHNDSEPPVVMASRAVVVTIPGEADDQVYIPAVAGILLRYDFFMKVLNSSARQCFNNDNVKCFLLDDGAFVIASSDPDDKFKTGRFFGDTLVEPNVMAVLVQEGVYTKKSEFDYQAICQPKPPHKAISSVGAVKSVLIPAFYDILTLSWWTTKLSWFYSSVGLFQWIFANQQLTVDAQIDTTTASSQNESCVMEQAQYYLHNREIIANTTCGSCFSTISTAAVDETNLIFVKVTPYCENCNRQFPSPSPKQVDDIYANNCNVTVRFRVRNPCYDYNPNEILECFGVRLLPNISLIFVGILLTWSWQRR